MRKALCGGIFIWSWLALSTISPANADPGLPTISDPQGVKPVIMYDVYQLICNEYQVSGVSVPTVRSVLNILMNDEDYQYSPRDATKIAGAAVAQVCPEHVPALRANAPN
jgi:hypothetical protein